MAQHAILRFEKHQGNPARPLAAHHERQKEHYASNPDIDTSRSKYNFHIVKRSGRYYPFIQSRIEQAGCRTRKDSTRFVDTLITASPEFFKGTLTQAGANTISISSSRRDAITTSFRAVSSRPGAEPARTAHGLSIR